MSAVSPEPKLLRSRFDSRALPAHLALPTWNEAIGVIFDSRSRKGVEDGFFASVDAAFMGEVALGRLKATAQDFDRSRYKIARDGMDGYLLQFYLRGQSATRGSNAEVAGEGDLYVIDMAQPLATSTSDHDQISLVVPRRLMTPRLDGPDGVHMRVIPAGLPLVSLFRDSLKSFQGQIDGMSRREAEAALPPLLDLAAAAINGHVDERSMAGVNLAQFVAVRRHVEERLLDPGLTLDGVLAAFGLSRRKAYRLFEPVGGFATYVNRRRLQRSLLALRAPEWRHLTISEIGSAHGFANAENFSRAFRREYGLSPREVRQLAATGRSLSEVAGALPETEWTRWIGSAGR
ncbi:helix-turn-helix domain-containing protein [Pleomorphomonas koreensis]|uniref:helix-turn-helix domain-containing protein n=1 Tax=Pleomorphomonas koreensis TaxID=257440 RepID=UPI00040B4249|nr:helix-turn-helix domain-containing protein [Pleomorphomonas koreensis]